VVAGYGGIIVPACLRHLDGQTWPLDVQLALHDRFVWCEEDEHGADAALQPSQEAAPLAVA